MKKVLLLGVLSFTGVGLATKPASAGLFDWLPGCGGSSCSVKINYRPYNAFDPGCCGMSVHGNLCGMFGGMGYGPGWVPPPIMPPYCNDPGGSSFNSGCCDAGCLPSGIPESAPSVVPGAPAAPPAGGQDFVPPMPTPLKATSQTYYYPTPVTQNMVNPAGYYPNYNPGYYPNYQQGYYPPMQNYPMQYNPYGMPNNYGYGR